MLRRLHLPTALSNEMVYQTEEMNAKLMELHCTTKYLLMQEWVSINIHVVY